MVAMIEGWLLDLHPVGPNSMALWIKKGPRRVYMHTVEWFPKIYLAGPLPKLIELYQCLSNNYRVRIVEKSIEPGRKPRQVLEVSVPIGFKKTLAKSLLEMGNYTVFRAFNVDLPSTQSFLYEHDIFPTGSVIVENDQITSHESQLEVNYDVGWMQVARLVVVPKRSGVIPQLSDRIERILLKIGNENVELDGEEDAIIQELGDVLEEFDIDVILTMGGDSFQLPYLQYRASLLGVKLRLNRIDWTIPINTKSYSYMSYGKIYRSHAPRFLKGRIHVDLENSMLVSTTGLAGLIEVSRVARIPLQLAARYTIGMCMSSLQYYQAYRLGVLIPWNPNATSYIDAKSLRIADRGGLVLDAAAGIYWNVGEIDFQSLYPQLMVKYNISGETINCECCMDEGEKVPELGFHTCKKWRGIVPRAIESIIARRLIYKMLYKSESDQILREIYKARSDALKWILVTSFGYLGFRKAKFGRREAHMAVCSYAREVLLKSIKLAERRGFKVIHGIVDSVWIWKKNASDDEYSALAEEIERKTGLPVSYEGRYKWIVFLNSKTHPSRPVNNRYFGVFKNGTLKYRGIEARRHDTPLIVKKMQIEMLNNLSRADTHEQLVKEAEKCKQLLNQYIRRVLIGDVDLEELVISRSLYVPIETYSNNTCTLSAARILRRMGLDVGPGTVLSYILGRDEGSLKAIPIEISKTRNYDSKRYVEMLRSAAHTILEPIIGKFKT